MLSIYLIMSTSINPSIYLIMSTSINPSIYLSIYLIMSTSINPSIYLSIYLIMSTSINPSIYLFIYLSIEGDRSLMIMAIGNEYDSSSSNSGGGCLHFTFRKAWKHSPFSYE